ncbi:DNA glycosylase AlkZ-like family protein [Microbacterium gorillae]|uniref:DNA glycosylase AlkZ-like family protein n=1 Tax=Microbacterium gorillae TaxID=1231063 RepID=UPI000693C5CA|nr:crosslink repair DNA glycosylase YcaQ family protein [Microbacterium gorillae]
MIVDRAVALGWRLRQHALDPVDGLDAATIVHRLAAVRGWPIAGADLSVALRQVDADPRAVSRALDAGDLIRSYAFRGGSYVFTHADASAMLVMRSVSRIWESERWQRQGGFHLDDWQPLRDALRDVLSDGPKTRDEISAALAGSASLAHLAAAATGAGADALYKPLHWWGDICFGPPRGQQTTFRRLQDDPRWPGLPAAGEDARAAILRYLAAYGPATDANLEYWFVEGLGVPRRLLRGWLDRLIGAGVTAVHLAGDPAYARTVDLDDLASAEPSDVVRLLPAYDPWVLGPGTADPAIVAPARRALLSRGERPVLRGGAVCGTWRLTDATVAVSWFAEAGAAPHEALRSEASRVAGVLGREADCAIEVRPAAG